MKLKRLFVLPHKVEYAEGLSDPERYVLVFFNDAEFDVGEWALWIPGHELVRECSGAELWTGETCHGLVEQYYMLPRSAFQIRLYRLAHYLRWLAGLEADPSPTALVNFMA